MGIVISVSLFLSYPTSLSASSHAVNIGPETVIIASSVGAVRGRRAFKVLSEQSALSDPLELVKLSELSSVLPELLPSIACQSNCSVDDWISMPSVALCPLCAPSAAVAALCLRVTHGKNCTQGVTYLPRPSRWGLHTLSFCGVAGTTEQPVTVSLDPVNHWVKETRFFVSNKSLTEGGHRICYQSAHDGAWRSLDTFTVAPPVCVATPWTRHHQPSSAVCNAQPRSIAIISHPKVSCPISKSGSWCKAHSTLANQPVLASLKQNP